jgi:2-polyprenyl-6-methoxyphenol hydroxylase-like FAD-dependent oxidoreductase
MPPIPRLPPSGITVLIIGAGFAGLTAAIECDRKGHTVLLLEKSPALHPPGDIISFGQNSSRFFDNWPGVRAALDPLVHKAEEVHFRDWLGRAVTTQDFRGEHRAWGRRVNGRRGEIHAAVWGHLVERGVEVRLGCNVVEYFEEEGAAGVVTDTGERFTADVVLAAEGVRSRGRTLVLGCEDKPLPSGYAVFRTWFEAGEVARNEKTRFLVEGGDSHYGWIGEDVHFLAASIKDGKEISWVCTHKDEGGIEESWQFPGRIEDVLKVVEGWDPVVVELVKMTPPQQLFDYKLVFRDPLPTFVSPKARTVLIGDAAHPFLPTSIQGASQAMEDGVVLAACLDKAGKDRVQEALRVWERIRYERVHKIQQTGVSTREQWHKADWDAIWKDPESLHLKREAWILNFDAEADAYASYDAVREKLEGERADLGKSRQKL